MSNDNTNPTPPTTPEVAPQTAPAPAPRRRTGLIVAGVATVAILAAGVGAGFAVALSDDDDSTEFSTSSSNGGSVSGETDLDGMLDAASTALTAADGDVVAIEERTDGTWRVEGTVQPPVPPALPGGVQRQCRSQHKAQCGKNKFR